MHGCSRFYVNSQPPQKKTSTRKVSFRAGCKSGIGRWEKERKNSEFSGWLDYDYHFGSDLRSSGVMWADLIWSVFPFSAVIAVLPCVCACPPSPPLSLSPLLSLISQSLIPCLHSILSHWLWYLYCNYYILYNMSNKYILLISIIKPDW